VTTTARPITAAAVALLLAAAATATVTTAVAAEVPAAAVPAAAVAAAVPPVDVARLLERVRARLREAEGAMLSKDRPRADAILAEIEASLAGLRRDRGAEIPRGHVAAFVLDERIAVLKRQLAAIPAAAGTR
jgi:hypothetical protein